jgi:serine/threonine protein kinase/tetratricopeptide (TPR) repeat protein
MSAVQSVGPYRLGERVGASVWKAVDTRNEKQVALKILTKQLPKDQTKRDAFIREVRVAAALYHHFLVPIVEIVPIGDNLILVMEFVEVQSFSQRVGGKPLSRQDFFRLAYQLVDVVKFLHTKGLVHGNINTDSVMVTPKGQVKLGGLNLTNLLVKREGVSGAYQQKGSDARSVAYMAPEQISGQTADARTDVYSLGVVMYEMATGRLPYQASNAADFARAVVEGQPLSPKAVYPEIDHDILIVLGRCLFKDQYRRHKDAKAILDDISKVEPDAARFANELTAKVVTSPTATQDAAARQSILLLADIANLKQISQTDPEAAARATARMQQILGEAVFLFDGQIPDPFGSRFIAELPTVESALEAGRKGEFDFSAEQQEPPVIPVRLLLHAGAVTAGKDGALSGDAINKGFAALEQIQPLQLHLSEDFTRKARGAARVRDAGARGGLKLYTIVPSEPVQKPPSAPEVEPTVKAAADEAVTMLSEADEIPPPRRSLAVPIAIGAIVLLAIGGAAAWFLLRGEKKADAAPKAVAAAPATAPVPVAKKVTIHPISIEGADADGTLAVRANAIRTGALEILRSTRGVEVADVPAPDVPAVAPVIRAGLSGPELLPAPGDPNPPVLLTDHATGIRSVLQWLAAKAGIPGPQVNATPEALNAFAEACVALGANDFAKAEPAIVAAAADPNFLPAQKMAMRFFAAQGKNAEAIAAGKRVVALEPANLEASRNLGRLALGTGDVQSAFAAFGAILKEQGTDMEALTHVARYAAASGDSARFTRTLVRLNTLSPQFVSVHAPDLLLVSGQIDTAVERYYDIESKVPNNAALSLKIGKIAVLRRSMPIAELELKKLRDSDPVYGYHMLKAYMDAAEGRREDAIAGVEKAGAAMTPGDDFWTSVAEVYAILGGTTEVLDALERAAARKEPTATYVLTNPLFSYLRSDDRFRALRVVLTSQQAEIRTALEQAGV